MTIATFCRDQLLAHGPLTADDLGQRAAAAGVTRAASPRSAVMSTMHGREIQLPDDRYVTPLWLLEGRCLTTPALGLPEWSCDPRDTSQQDLGLLHVALNLAPVALVGGGYLRQYGWHGRWTCNRPLPEPTPDELICVRVTGGELELTTIGKDAVASPEPAVVAALNQAADDRRWSYSYDTGTAVNRALAELILADAALLRSPLPPLHTFVDALGREVRAMEQTDLVLDDASDTGFVELRLHLDLARRLERIAELEGLTSAEWVERQIDLHAYRHLQPPLRLVP
jgi:hypothetical protein